MIPVPNEIQLSIVPYTKERKAEWDGFITTSRNGTFLFKRDYMDYHADRFTDCSFLFYKGKHLLALLPGNIAGTVYQTHGGLTYGGFILSSQMTTTLMLEAFYLFCCYLRAERPDVNQVVYRPVPFIYHRYPCEEDLYALFRANASLIERKISSAVSLESAYPFGTLRRRKVKRAVEHGLVICQDNDFSSFWSMLEDNLHQRHNRLPVHTLEEMICLQVSFPDEIKLYRVTDGGETVGGCVMYLTSEVAHVQYIASTEQGRDAGALDYLFDYLICTCYTDKRYFDFGVSVEEGGHWLNEGLIFQKEGFGGRGVVYDTYQFSLNSVGND